MASCFHPSHALPASSRTVRGRGPFLGRIEGTRGQGHPRPRPEVNLRVKPRGKQETTTDGDGRRAPFVAELLPLGDVERESRRNSKTKEELKIRFGSEAVENEPGMERKWTHEGQGMGRRGGIGTSRVDGAAAGVRRTGNGKGMDRRHRNIVLWCLVLWMGVARACNGREGECYHKPCSVLGTSSEVLGKCIQTKQNGKDVPSVLQKMAAAVERVEGSLNDRRTILEILNALNGFVNGGSFPNPVVYICEDDVFIEVNSCIDPPPPWKQMCSDFTESESQIREGTEGGVAMVVSEPYLGDRAFTRFVFNSNELIQTQEQGSWHDPSIPFSCMQRPWYNEKSCNDPLGTTCEYQFASAPLLGATQFLGYGLEGDGRCGVLGTDVSPTNVNGCLV